MSFSAGCQILRPDPIAVARPYNISPELAALDQQPIEIGKPNKVIDTIGNIVGIPSKLLLWNCRIDNHRISGETIHATADYMAANDLGHVKVRANQYAPLKDWQRLKANKTMHWLSRYTLGVLALGGEAILPGRIVGGDHFNPFTQTVHLYSDVPAIAWHELAHAKDFSRRDAQASYALAYTAVPIWHETVASQDVMSYVADRGDREEIASTIEILYPAYGTYAGSAASAFGGAIALPIYYGSVVGAHLNARQLARRVRRGDDLGPLTSIAVSSLIDQYDDHTTPMTSFRDTRSHGHRSSTSLSAGSLSAGISSMKYDPRVTIRMPDSQLVELGDDWGIGIAAVLELDNRFQRPVTIAYTGNSSDSSAIWSSTTLDPYGFDALYQQDFHDVFLGYRVDSNDPGQPLHPLSDQILLGLRYVYFADQIDERVLTLPSGFAGLQQYDSEFTATNNILAPSIQFQRRYQWGRWTARGGVGGFAGLAGIDQSTNSVATDTSGQRHQGSQRESQSVSISTGQTAELAIGAGLGSRWEIQGGVRASNVTGVATSIRDYAGDRVSDPTDIFGWGGFLGLESHF